MAHVSSAHLRGCLLNALKCVWMEHPGMNPASQRVSSLPLHVRHELLDHEKIATCI